MAKAEQQLSSNQQSLEAAPATKASYMVVPIVTMVVSMVGFMLWTGNGVLAQGSGSKSVLYATILATAVAYLMLVFGKRFTHHEAVETGFKGMGEILPLVTIVLLSLTLGSSLKVLGTGEHAGILVQAISFQVTPFVAECIEHGTPHPSTHLHGCAHWRDHLELLRGRGAA